MIRKFIFAASAALLIATLSSCGNSGENKQQNETQQPTEQTQPEAKPESTTEENTQVAPKDTNKKYVCEACKEYFDNPGTCEKCGMELVENVDYKE